MNANNIAFAGDRILTDVMYANRAGMYSIYIREIISIENDNKLAQLVCLNLVI